ncbi:hypothetical protein DYB37_005374 [Aphanomyces astaci]|uniref:Uncharacterized protein n=1 Tax=Aphanomyces astaci TaxID=112090 RepID=A0A3R7BAJ3_APHAT|nr:hypothetical protein DYB35_006273 [Aphanomyces astaci]RHZ03809.1 hypothetical protein DYB37_005374 [Aphanomyces astaci]
MTKMRNHSFAKSRRALQETNEPLPVIGKKSQSIKCINQRKPVNQEALAGANGQGMLVASQTTRPDKSLELQLMAYEDLDVTVPLSFEQNGPAPILKTRHQLRFFERILVPTCIVRGLKLGECDANVVIISKKAQGYTPSGLLFLVVGYQASASVLSLRLSDTEYDAWGYGRAVSGFELFCRWLCVVYVKRKRRFNLVWCGSACPRPLRARVDDEAVVCIHKEGMKLPSSTSSFGHEYALVAIYLRQTTSTLTFVVASMGNHSVVEVSTNIDETIANDFEVCASSCDSAVDVTFRQRRRQRVVSTAVTTYSIGDLTSCPIVFAGSVALTDGPSSHVQVYDSGMNYVVRSTSGGEATHYATVCKDDVNPLGISLGTQELRAMFADTRVYGVNCAVNVPWLQHCICTYARMFSVARFGIQQHGRYYLVTVVVMQDKLEYRSGLVFRAMQIRGPLGQGAAAVSFSTVLRTTNGLSSVVLGLSAPCSEVTSDDQNSLQASSQQPECGEIMHCQSCLNRICNVLRGGGAVDVCFHQAIPVRVCFSAFCTPESVARLKSCLQQHSSSLSRHRHRILVVRCTVTDQMLDVQTVEDANFGLTGRSVQHYLTEGHWRGLAVFVVPTEEFHLGGRESQDVDLVHRIHDLVQQQHDVAACDASSIDAPNFENYLIAEALVMEATMMCYSASSLKKPSTITGASSWKFACQLLTNPHRFYERFNRHVAWATMSESVATTLLQFQSHPEWKLVDQIDQMKAPFQALYRWLDNGMHLLQAIRDRNGLLSHDFTSPTNAWTVVAV